jgi:hypothetical protein
MDNQPVPFFRGGYCFVNDWRAALRAYAPDGTFAFASVPRLPGTDAVEIIDVAVDPGAGFVIAVWSKSAKGLVLLDQNGIQTTFIPTAGFTPAHVAVSEDHSIWVGGDFGYKPPGDHMIIHKYSKTGSELGAYVPFSSFPEGTINPIMTGPDTTVLVGGGVVVVTARSGSGSNTDARLRELIRMDYSGNILTRTRFDNVRGEAMILTSDGALYQSDGHGVPNSPVFRFRSPESWQRVARPDTRSVLFGSDQQDLVYMIPSKSEKITLQWYPQP